MTTTSHTHRNSIRRAGVFAVALIAGVAILAVADEPEAVVSSDAAAVTAQAARPEQAIPSSVAAGASPVMLAAAQAHIALAPFGAVARQSRPPFTR